jgi:hypothetical protein
MHTDRASDNSEKLQEALSAFKDWSNYLLITTVAALGWVTEVATSLGNARGLVIWCFCLSVVFAIFTLALIPLVAESITPTTCSIYAVTARFKLLWMWGPEVGLQLKAVCWPQHILFLLGIIIYAGAYAV